MPEDNDINNQDYFEHQCQINRQRVRDSRINESPRTRDSRLQADRNYRAQRRAAATPAELEARRAATLQRTNRSRANESAASRSNRQAFERQRHSRIANQRASSLHCAAFSYSPDEDLANHPLITIGDFDFVCKYCHARRFKNESDGLCCAKGKIKFALTEQPPEPILSLFSGDYPDSRDFLRNIRRYNCCFQMTSFGSTGGHHHEGFMPTFRVQGQIYHKIGALLPMPEAAPKFLQIYFTGDSACQIDIRTRLFQDVKRGIVATYQELFDQHNELIRTFRSTLDRLPSDHHQIVIRADKRPEGQHARVFNAPTTNEVAVVMVDSELSRRDIVLQRRDSQLKRIDESHPFYDSFQYPLIFWRGQGSWHFNMKQINPITGQDTNKRVSPMDYYAYQLMIRDDHQNFLLKCGPLLNQFVVDMYAKIEAQRLLYYRTHQKQLRAEEYIHLRDAMRNDANANDIGQPVILPSSHAGSPRHMHEYSQDALTYVRQYGKPDLFITFTCNAKWPEIMRHLKEYQQNFDRHDITARVFKQKLSKLIDSFVKFKIFGPVRCYIYTIEWQKRGLPHAHILLWLHEKIRLDQIDDIISAELPDPQFDPELFNIVKKCMVHGPCGSLNLNSPCMDDNHKCTKKYPRPFVTETQTDNDSYPLYRRRSPDDGGHSFSTNISNIGQITIDNRWIVPYCPLLSKMFNAHINVEFCQSVKSIKYICKYITKGSDMAMLQLDSPANVDEIEQYQLGRYISSSEAFWRIFSFQIHARHPAVTHLAVHLENGQRVYFTEANAAQRAENPPKTTLTAFFSLCQSDTFAQNLLYTDVPRYYTWNAPKRIFVRRKNGTSFDPENLYGCEALGRLYTVHPSQMECFFLRMLLTKVRGPKSFEDLRKFEGRLFATYREACQARGLLEDDQHWGGAMQEAAATKRPHHLRSLFSVIISNCFPSNPTELWERFKEDMSEDILHQLQVQNPSLNMPFTQHIFNQALILIEDLCISMCGKLLNQLGLPAPDRSSLDPLNSEVLRETSYNREEMEQLVLANLPNLVQDQKLAYDAIIDAVQNDRGGLFFIDAPGGTGKTFILNLILARIRQEGDVVLAVASSGIAATLLAGGRTAHSAFKLPLDLHRMDEPICSISRGSAKAKLLQRSKAIIWDECTMAHKKSLEALNRTLKDIRSNDLLFGGVVVILAGDFRQTLPVIQRATPADQLNACLKQSPLWGFAKKLNLSTNMRVHLQGDIQAGQFAAKLLSIGDGTFPHDALTKRIKLQPDFCQPIETRDEIINKVFPDLLTNIHNHNWLCERAILAPKNNSVDELNELIQDKLIDIPARSYFSIDQTLEADQAVHYPVEFLNSLSPAGAPPHELKLKIGSPIMLLRNLRPPKLCNGTRLVVKSLHNNMIEATILSGPYKGEDTFIPRIPFIPNDMPFDFKRTQFPVKLAYGFTVNKSQGQSLRVVGVDLTDSCFSHGQLYVACSRVGNPSNLYILAPGGETKNVVYQQALN